LLPFQYWKIKKVRVPDCSKFMCRFDLCFSKNKDISIESLQWEAMHKKSKKTFFSGFIMIKLQTKNKRRSIWE